MYTPKFLISHKILKNIGLVEAAREVIENAPIVPDFEKEFQEDAVVRTVYHGTHIEGNDLSLLQTRQVLEGEAVVASARDVQEVINYRKVVEIISDLAQKRGGYEPESLKEIHWATVFNLVPSDKAGVYRTTQVVIREEGTGNVIFTPPSPVQVPFLVADVFDWLNDITAQEIHPVIRAAITHYVLVTIHPFIEGNGRTTRAFANLVMLKEGYDLKRFFAIEEHFDHDLDAYYDAFFHVDTQGTEIQDRDLTPWIEYFCEVVAIELTKIKEKIRKVSVDSRMKLKIGEQVALSARQMKLIEYLNEKGRAGMKELKETQPMISEDTILRDLKDLLKKGIIEKEGSTKASVYVIKG
jgi:Fic family protein